MNIKNFETFYWIARLGSFTAAAERVITTQSTVSMRIREIEQSLGVKLFDRSHRTARLTPKGKELLFYVERLLELTTEMQQRITPMDTTSGLIRVGVVEIIASTWLPRFIRTLRDSYPNVALELEIALTGELLEKMTGGALDVVFALGMPPNGGYASESLGSIQLEWMASPELGVPARTVSPKELEVWPFITLNRLSYHHTAVQNWIHKHQVRCRKMVVCNSMTIAATLASEGLGICLLPPICYQSEIESGKLHVIRATGHMPPVEFSAMYPLGEFQPLAPVVTDLAVRISGRDQPRGNWISNKSPRDSKARGARLPRRAHADGRKAAKAGS